MTIMKTRLLETAVCGVLAIGLAEQARGQLVTDGTFQVGDQLARPVRLQRSSLTDWWSSTSPNSYDFVYTPGSILAGVTGEHGNVPLNGPSGAIPGGGNALGIDPVFQNGNGANSTTSQPVYQTVTGLNAGSTYALSFWWAASQQQGFSGATTEAWEASLGASAPEETSIYSNPSGGSSSWMEATMDFTATSSSEVLSFIAVGTPGIPAGQVSGDPPFCLLSDVSLTQTSNAPDTASTMALLGLVASAMGIARFRRQARK